MPSKDLVHRLAQDEACVAVLALDARKQPPAVIAAAGTGMLSGEHLDTLGAVARERGERGLALVTAGDDERLRALHVAAQAGGGVTLAPLVTTRGNVVGSLVVETRGEEPSPALRLALELSAKIAAAALETGAVPWRFSTLGQMAGNIAHEIATPIAIVRGRTQQLLRALDEGRADVEVTRRSLRDVLATSDRLSRIVKSLKALARGDESEREPLTVVRVGDVVEEAAELCRMRLVPAGVALQLDEARLDERCICRRLDLSHALLNLLNNAVDAVAGRDERWIRIDVTRVGNELEIGVSDSGPGIPPAMRAKIFSGVTTKEEGKGTGLGLSLSRRLLVAQGGSLTLDESAACTRFVLRLPAAAGLGAA